MQKQKEQPSDKYQSRPASKFHRYLCPCLLPSALKQTEPEQFPSSVESKTDKGALVKIKDDQFLNKNSPRHQTSTKRRVSQEISEMGHSKRQNLLHKQADDNAQKTARQSMSIQLSYNNRLRSMQELKFSVSSFTQNYLISLGSNCEHILLKVSPVVIQTKPFGFKRGITQQLIKKENKNKYLNYEFNRYWNQRYELFERFDEGIKIKEESWAAIPSEALAEYIANKCNGANTVLDGFAQMGSVSIRLANLNSCAKVIANEVDKQKLSFLLENAKIYEIDSFLELSNQNFLKIERKNIDVVFVNPPSFDWSIQKHNLDAIIGKAMTLAPNLVMLLPPQTGIESLTTLVYKWAKRLAWMQQFCSVKIEKIYQSQQLRYILVCAGKLVQNEIKLSDELEYIYTKLKKSGDKVFKHKKIVKKIRQQYGMLQLLNIVKISQKAKKQAFLKNPINNQDLLTIDFFYDVILEKNMISHKKMQKLRMEQDQSLSKAGTLLHSGQIADDISYQASPLTEEEKMDNSPSEGIELTASQYSYMSYFESFGGRSRQQSDKKTQRNSSQVNSVRSSGVVIKRTINSSIREGQVSKDGSAAGQKKEQGDKQKAQGVRDHPKHRVTLTIEVQKQGGYRKQSTLKDS